MTPPQKIPKGLPNFVRHFSTLFNKRVIADIENGKSDFSIIFHTGRKSSRAYRTPVDAIFLGNEVIIGLVYGRKTDWLQNVLAHGGCKIFYKLQTYAATDPVILPVDSARELLSPGSTGIPKSGSPGEYLHMIVTLVPAKGKSMGQVFPA